MVDKWQLFGQKWQLFGQKWQLFGQKGNYLVKKCLIFPEYFKINQIIHHLVCLSKFVKVTDNNQNTSFH
jgi:hypothetical protein